MNSPWRSPFREKQNATLSRLEQFSIECRKTKAKVIAPAYHRGHRKYGEPIKARSHDYMIHNAGKRVRGFGFTSDWMRKWREFFKPIGQQSCSEVTPIQLLFDTRTKITVNLP